MAVRLLRARLAKCGFLVRNAHRKEETPSAPSLTHRDLSVFAFASRNCAFLRLVHGQRRAVAYQFAIYEGSAISLLEPHLRTPLLEATAKDDR